MNLIYTFSKINFIFYKIRFNLHIRHQNLNYGSTIYTDLYNIFSIHYFCYLRVIFASSIELNLDFLSHWATKAVIVTCDSGWKREKSAWEKQV